MNLLHTILAFVLALGVLIVFHEFGHYLVARACGVKVLRFCVGFGRPVFSRRVGRDGTEWAIAAFPLGGYVKMLDEREGDVAPGELHRAFNRQGVYRRIAIVAAGPMANFLLAVLLYWVLFLTGVPGLRPVLGEPPAGSPAAAAGVRVGETVVRAGDQPVATWQDLRWHVLQRAVDREPLHLEVTLPGGGAAVRAVDLSGVNSNDLDQDFLRSIGLVLDHPPLPAVIGKVLPGSAAERAGLQPGDAVRGVGGRAIERWDELVRTVRGSPAAPLQIEVKRDGRTLRLEVLPDAVTEGGERVGKIGVGPQPPPEGTDRLSIEVRYGPVDAMGRALNRTWEMSAFTVRMLWKMVAGDVSWRNVSGPITIADYAGQSAQMGVSAYLGFLALISISLAVLNLLPIPLLDGGHLLYYTAEIIKGRPVSERAMEIGQQVGLALLLTLMAFAIYNDINRLVSG